jgi:hypothetical protein
MGKSIVNYINILQAVFVQKCIVSAYNLSLYFTGVRILHKMHYASKMLQELTPMLNFTNIYEQLLC